VKEKRNQGKRGGTNEGLEEPGRRGGTKKGEEELKNKNLCRNRLKGNSFD
jgi:hypothetical protein